ncbi:MAG TPA: serine/threonine-protein kinase [Pyrinomonadaceae bacterium]|jgi:serine/threonine-protein kinase
MDVPHIIAGRFRIECEIGTGGMGTVYRATHLGLERPVAVKIIKPEFAADQDVADRFMREARTMAKLRHPHAAMIFDAGNLPDGRHFIVMEFVEGRTLSEIQAREGRFTPERAVRIAADICDVLSEAHQLGIIHRDLKPSNIMLNDRGICVLDFGVAKVLTGADATATHATTGSGVIVGTPRYMSPEQCLGQSVGARSDLYSLGVLLYEMLTGRPPFVDALQSAVLVKQATAAPPPLPQLRPDVPRALAVAIHTLLAKRPENRPQNAEAARKLLEKSIVRPPQTLSEEQPFSGTVAALNMSSRSVVFRAVAPVALIAVLGLALLSWGRSGQTAPAPAAALNDETPARTNSTASRDSTYYAAPPPVTLPPQQPSQPLPSLEAARQIARSVSQGTLSDVRVLKTERDAAIVALHDERREGNSHIFALERKGAQYHVAAKAALDAPDFRGATWTAEALDVDGDGYDEVLYAGTNPRKFAADRRLVLYVPRTRQSYALRVENRSGGQKPSRITLSPNAQTRAATPYRAALQQHATTSK